MIQNHYLLFIHNHNNNNNNNYNNTRECTVISNKSILRCGSQGLIWHKSYRRLIKMVQLLLQLINTFRLVFTQCPHYRSLSECHLTCLRDSVLKPLICCGVVVVESWPFFRFLQFTASVAETASSTKWKSSAAFLF